MYLGNAEHDQEISYLEKSILKYVDSVIGKSNQKFEICFIILRKKILFLTSMFYFAIYLLLFTN